MYKFKIFYGDFQCKADTKANKWLEEHQNVLIINISYQQANSNDHSICIVYKED